MIEQKRQDFGLNENEFSGFIGSKHQEDYDIIFKGKFTNFNS